MRFRADKCACIPLGLEPVIPFIQYLKLTHPSTCRKNMPNLTIINGLDEAIHVAFYITAPTHWKNNLLPGERWTTHLPTLPLYFQARWVQRTDSDSGAVYQSRAFCPEDSWEMGKTIGVACAAGTASVVTAATSVLTGWQGVGVPLIAGPLMVAANAGKTFP